MYMYIRIYICYIYIYTYMYRPQSVTPVRWGFFPDPAGHPWESPLLALLRLGIFQRKQSKVEAQIGDACFQENPECILSGNSGNDDGFERHAGTGVFNCKEVLSTCDSESFAWPDWWNNKKGFGFCKQCSSGSSSWSFGQICRITSARLSISFKVPLCRSTGSQRWMWRSWGLCYRRICVQ